MLLSFILALAPIPTAVFLLGFQTTMPMAPPFPDLLSRLSAMAMRLIMLACYVGHLYLRLAWYPKSAAGSWLWRRLWHLSSMLALRLLQIP